MPNWLVDPLTTAPSRGARYLADKIDPPTGEGGRMRGFLAGALTGAGDLASDMTSPAGIASSILPGGLGRLRTLSRLHPRALLSGRGPSYDLPEEELAMLYERLGPEFIPIGGEDVLNTARTARQLDEAARMKDLVNANEEVMRGRYGHAVTRGMGVGPSERFSPDVMSRTMARGNRGY